MNKKRINIFYRLTKQKEKQLNLDAIEDGFDSLQIRIWFEHSFIEDRELLVIKKVNSSWVGELHFLKVEWNDSSITETVVQHKELQKAPISGWENFMSKLFRLKIMSLPDISKIPGYGEGLVADGTSFSVEVATNKIYRFYRYWEPGDFPEYWQVKNMADIIKLIEVEFQSGSWPNAKVE
jgi:hypothetical protein